MQQQNSTKKPKGHAEIRKRLKNFVGLCAISSWVSVKQQNPTKKHKGHAEIHKRLKNFLYLCAFFRESLCDLFTSLCATTEFHKEAQRTRRDTQKIKKLRGSLCYFFAGLCETTESHKKAQRTRRDTQKIKKLRVSLRFFRESLCDFFASLCATTKLLLNYNFMFISVLRSTFTGVLFKRFTEVTKIIKSAFITNFINTYRFLRQKL